MALKGLINLSQTSIESDFDGLRKGGVAGLFGAVHIKSSSWNMHRTWLVGWLGCCKGWSWLTLQVNEMNAERKISHKGENLLMLHCASILVQCACCWGGNNCFIRRRKETLAIKIHLLLVLENKDLGGGSGQVGPQCETMNV